MENGSTDDTTEVVRALAAERDWIQLLPIDPPARPARGFASTRAFNAGVEWAGLDAEFITNVDADVSFEPEYFAKLRDEFDRRPCLGIASGLC